METVQDEVIAFGNRKALRENHSGMETMLPDLLELLLSWLRENHSGMETLAQVKTSSTSLEVA